MNFSPQRAQSATEGAGVNQVTHAINECVIVELKCVEKIAAVHQAQLISYMRLSKKSIGLLINFHVRHLKDGIKRFVEGTDWN